MPSAAAIVSGDRCPASRWRSICSLTSRRMPLRLPRRAVILAVARRQAAAEQDQTGVHRGGHLFARQAGGVLRQLRQMRASMRVAPCPGSNSVPCSLRLRSAVRRSRGTVRVMVEMSVVRVSASVRDQQADRAGADIDRVLP